MNLEPQRKNPKAKYNDFLYMHTRPQVNICKSYLTANRLPNDLIYQIVMFQPIHKCDIHETTTVDKSV